VPGSLPIVLGTFATFVAAAFGASMLSAGGAGSPAAEKILGAFIFLTCSSTFARRGSFFLASSTYARSSSTDSRSVSRGSLKSCWRIASKTRS
jgi:hypothetical protein